MPKAQKDLQSGISNQPFNLPQSLLSRILPLQIKGSSGSDRQWGLPKEGALS